MPELKEAIAHECLHAAASDLSFCRETSVSSGAKPKPPVAKATHKEACPWVTHPHPCSHSDKPLFHITGGQRTGRERNTDAEGESETLQADVHSFENSCNPSHVKCELNKVPTLNGKTCNLIWKAGLSHNFKGYLQVILKLQLML